MDANRFDGLVKRLTTTRLTRGRALRGVLAGAVAAVTGLSHASLEAGAKNKKRKKNFCVCTGNTVSSCSDQKIKGKKKKKVLQRFPCSYRGKCRGFNPCSPAPTGGGGGPTPAAGLPISVDINILGDTCTVGGNECGDSAVTGLVCSAIAPLICVPVDADLGIIGATCDTGADCATGSCALGLCVACAEVCGTGNDQECCVVDAECDPVLNICVF